MKDWLYKFLGLNYIVHDNSNSMWNNGRVSVYVTGKCVECIFVDDTNKYSSEIIDDMRVKYSIKEKNVMVYETSWR